MTPFQKKCIDACSKFFMEKFNMKLIFSEKLGKAESYFVGQANGILHSVEIYIYDNEAGLMIDGKDWIVCERPDYDSDGMLISSFLAELAKWIMPE